MNEKLARELREIGTRAGLCAVGFTSADVLEPARSTLRVRKAHGHADSMAFTYKNPERSTDATRTLPSAASLIAGAYDYRRRTDHHELTATSGSDVFGSLGAEAPFGVVARYAQRDHYADLRAGLDAMADHLRGLGFRAQVRADDNALVDRNVAWRAGLGWYGKNANLLIGGRGSWIVLGQVITDAELPGSSEPIEDGCGPCQRCLDDCPTQAIVAPGVIDARRCLAWLVQGPGAIPVEFREAVGNRIYGCDDCQDVCPPNIQHERADAETLPAAEPDSDKRVDLVWLLSASDSELMERVGRWYIADRDPNVVRRTALVALGNVGQPDSAEVIETLDRYAADPNEILAEHAQWAQRQLMQRSTA